jgi:YDG domain/Bacterial Ig-like domain (group 3)
MKRAWVILFLLAPLLVASSFASIITNDNTALVLFASSYDVSPYHYFGDYVGSWAALEHPQFTNHWSSASRGGGSIEEANDNRLERLGLAHWADSKRAIALIMADDDGGYTSNDVRVNLTNTFSAPARLFNGVAYTNEGGWASTQTVAWIGIGAIPHDSADGDSGEVQRNNAVTNMCQQVGLQGIDMWYPLWNNGWSNDAANGTHYLGFNPGSHPFASGSLAMGITIARALAGADTNISLAAVDWNAAAIVSTNHCVISGISQTGNTLTFTRHDDRLPMAWDVPDGTITNDCRNAFVGMSGLQNAFWFTIAVTNLPAGNYNVSIDGQQIITLSSSALASGWNMFSGDYTSQYWRQRVQVLHLIRLKNGTDPVTLLDHGAGDSGPFGRDLVNYYSDSQGYWDQGKRGDALIAALAFDISNLDVYDKLIHDAAQPTNHIFTITAVGQTITFPSPGDQTYGVGPITLGASASSGLPVSYSIVSGPATVAGSTLTITGAGSVTIQASQSGNATWPPAPPVNQVITIAPKTLTVTGVTASDKVYDGTVTATVRTNGAALVGVVGGDTVALGGTAAGTFVDANAGVGKTVTVSGLTIVGPAAGNYLLTQPVVTGNITPASTLNTVTSSLNPASPGSDVVFTATLSVVSPGSGTPTGNIVFKDGPISLATNALSGLSAALSTTALSHGSHTITAEYQGDGNFFGSTNNFIQVIDRPPVGPSLSLQRYLTSGAKIRAAALLTNDSDPDGDTLTLLSVSATSIAGGTVASNGDWICYLPPAGSTNSDSFSYVIADSVGLRSTNSVTITIGTDTNASQNAGLQGGGFGNNLIPIRFFGIPQRVYTIQSTTNLSTQGWQTLGTATANSNGFILFFDSPPPNSPPPTYRTTYP